MAARDNSAVNFRVTKDAVYSGNYATAPGSAPSDSHGGFLYLYGSNASYANFEISSDAKLTIGDGTAGYDSIASISNAEINKTGGGFLLVNSSMEYYTGTLNVKEGQMRVLNSLGAKDLAIQKDASLVLLSGGYTGKGNVDIDLDSSLTFILAADFDEYSENEFYLLEGTVTLSGFKDINDAVPVKYSAGSDYSGEWTVSLDKNGILFNPTIPEPSSFASLFGAAAMLMAANRRKR